MNSSGPAGAPDILQHWATSVWHSPSVRSEGTGFLQPLTDHSLVPPVVICTGCSVPVVVLAVVVVSCILEGQNRTSGCHFTEHSDSST